MINKKISTIGGSLIILAIVAALGFVLLSDKKKETQNQNNINQVTENKNNKDKSDEEQFKELNEQELAETKELTKNWKTFRDEEYGYEFKYPQDYYIVKSEEDEGYKATKIVSEKKYPGDGGCPNPPCNFLTHPQEINLRVFEDSKNLSIAEVKKRLEGNTWNKSSGKHLLVDSKQAFYYEGGSNQAETIYIFGDKKTFYISTDIEWSATDFKNIFKGIYSTFKEIRKETTLKKVKEEGVLTYYDGNIIISGKYQEMHPDRLFGGKLCFFTDNETEYLLPLKETSGPKASKRTAWFCFSNQNEAKKMLNINESIFQNQKDSSWAIIGNAKIEISNYVTDRAEIETSDTAKLEKIISKENYSLEEIE